jgi:hypothetical protein
MIVFNILGNEVRCTDVPEEDREPFEQVRPVFVKLINGFIETIVKMVLNYDNFKVFFEECLNNVPIPDRSFTTTIIDTRPQPIKDAYLWPIHSTIGLDDDIDLQFILLQVLAALAGNDWHDYLDNKPEPDTTDDSDDEVDNNMSQDSNTSDSGLADALFHSISADDELENEEVDVEFWDM